MGQYKIGTINYLSEDKAVIYDNNITTAINIYKVDPASKPVNDSVSSSQTATLVPPVNSTTINANGQTVTPFSQGVSVNGVGSNADSGKLTSIASSTLPNIYFNIRKNSFDSKSLYFRFKTSDISGSPGDQTNTWASDTNILSGLSLTGEANCLKITQAYGQKFYELASTKSIGISNFSFNVPKNPSYAFLVYALANASTTRALFSGSNQVHKFQASSDNSNTIYNNSYTAETTGRFGNTEQNYSVFSLSPLLSKQFISEYQQANGLDTVNINNSYFPGDFNVFQTTTRVITESGRNNSNPPPEFISNKFFNLCNTPNSLASPTATNTPFIINQGALDIPLNTFSLFFVEMYSYLELPSSNQQNAAYNILNVITKVNGLISYTAKILIKPDINYSNNINCNISIGNNPGSGGVRMFLFDYLYGTSRDVSSMTQDRNLILESLGYDNRKVLLKSSSDLQMTNANTSLRFPANLSHPFLNMYFS